MQKIFKQNELLVFGKNVFKVDLEKIKDYKQKGQLILVTSINPTPSGEGKTTTLIGINDCFNFYKKKSIACLRQPSIGPFFGIKGGATGSGRNELLNSELINLGFTGDFFAIETCNNLIHSMIENEVFNDSELNIDHEKILWNRCVDINDRSLREITYNISKSKQVTSSFNITAASHLMATFCLANSFEDLINKIENTPIAFSKTNEIVRVKDLKIKNSIKLILERAFNPNLTFSKSMAPVLIHGGPFANIAHGCNSIVASKVSLAKSDYVFTEAGFGADLGMEKFLNIKCREANLSPNLIVIVVTVKSILHHAQFKTEDINNLEQVKIALTKGLENLKKHVDSVKSFGLNFCVVINKFSGDSSKHLNFLRDEIKDNIGDCEISTMWQQGPSKNKHILDLILRNLKNEKITFTYSLTDPNKQKIEKIANKIYGAKNVIFSEHAIKTLEDNKNLIKDYFVCFAKTFSSLSGDATLLGRPIDFELNVDHIKINHSSKFIIPVVGGVFLMPGLPKIPNAKKI